MILQHFIAFLEFTRHITHSSWLIMHTMQMLMSNIPDEILVSRRYVVIEQRRGTHTGIGIGVGSQINSQVHIKQWDVNYLFLPQRQRRFNVYIPYKVMDVITYPWSNPNKSISIKGAEAVIITFVHELTKGHLNASCRIPFSWSRTFQLIAITTYPLYRWHSFQYQYAILWRVY